MTPEEDIARRWDELRAERDEARADADRLADALDGAAAIGHGMSLAAWWDTVARPALEAHEHRGSDR